MSGFFGHAGVEDHLKQQITKLILKAVHIILLNRFGDFVSFFDGVGGDGFKGLLHIPGAAVFWIAQCFHNF